MAENKTMRNDNIKKINEMLTKSAFQQTLGAVSSIEADAKALKKQIEEKLNLLMLKKAEEKAEQAVVEKAEEVVVPVQPEPAPVVEETKVVVEEKLTKTVPLHIEYSGQVAENHRAEKNNITLSSETVTITGPKSVVLT